MKRSKNRGFYEAVFFIFAALLLVGFMESKTAPRENKTLTSPASISAKSSPKSTPSATPTPTPTPNYGFCLRVPVLIYHHVQPQLDAITNKETSLSVDNGYFDQQMAYLNQNGYVTISAQELVDALRARTGLPGKSIVITADDGYADQYNYLLPIIKKYNLKINLMIATGLIGNPGYMTWDQVNEAVRSGLVYLVSHTWSHFPVDQGTPDKAKYEIETGRSQLEQFTGQRIALFAYPYGSFNNRVIQILQEDGFLGAFSIIPGFYQCDSFIMTLHRTHIGNAPLSSYGL